MTSVVTTKRILQCNVNDSREIEGRCGPLVFHPLQMGDDEMEEFIAADLEDAATGYLATARYVVVHEIAAQ